MRNVVRLTERDLSRIVRKVLKENLNGLPETAIQCALENFKLSDITLVPFACVTVGLNIITTKKLPPLTDKNVQECATKLINNVVSNEEAQKRVMSFAGCILEGVTQGTIKLPIPGQDGDGGVSIPGTDIKVQIPKFPGMNESRRRRYLYEDEMDLSSVSKLGEIEGVSDIPECSTDSENFNSAACLSSAMDTLSFNTFVKEFFPTFQQIATVTKTPLQTTSMNLPNVAESRRRKYRRY
jgi:hypothetical protein